MHGKAHRQEDQAEQDQGRQWPQEQGNGKGCHEETLLRCRAQFNNRPIRVFGLCPPASQNDRDGTQEEIERRSDVEEIGWTLVLAGFAGFVNYLQRFAGEPKPAWEWGAAGVKVVTGAFVGLLTLWLIGKRVEDPGIVKFAVAIAGYGGPLTLDFFWQSGRDFLASWAARAAQSVKDDEAKN